MAPFDDTGPLYGTVLPILISSLLTPTVSARAVTTLQIVATIAMADRTVLLTFCSLVIIDPMDDGYCMGAQNGARHGEYQRK